MVSQGGGGTLRLVLEGRLSHLRSSEDEDGRIAPRLKKGISYKVPA